jgi:hypothetical protein
MGSWGSPDPVLWFWGRIVEIAVMISGVCIQEKEPSIRFGKCIILFTSNLHPKWQPQWWKERLTPAFLPCPPESSSCISHDTLSPSALSSITLTLIWSCDTTIPPPLFLDHTVPLLLSNNSPPEPVRYHFITGTVITTSVNSASHQD